MCGESKAFCLHDLQEALDTCGCCCSFAAAYEGLLSDSVPVASYAYLSTSYLDDLAYAAAWLNVATGKLAHILERSNAQHPRFQSNLLTKCLDACYVKLPRHKADFQATLYGSDW